VRIRPYRTEQKGEIQGAVLAFFDIDRLKRSLEAGMDDVLTKPIDMEKLQSLILRYLEE
jgi:CheY-like chemotaxis protein